MIENAFNSNILLFFTVLNCHCSIKKSWEPNQSKLIRKNILIINIVIIRYVIVQLASVITGSTRVWVRERAAEKFAGIFYDPACKFFNHIN